MPRIFISASSNHVERPSLAPSHRTDTSSRASAWRPSPQEPAVSRMKTCTPRHRNWLAWCRSHVSRCGLCVLPRERAHRERRCPKMDCSGLVAHHPNMRSRQICPSSETKPAGWVPVSLSRRHSKRLCAYRGRRRWKRLRPRRGDCFASSHRSFGTLQGVCAAMALNNMERGRSTRR